MYYLGLIPARGDSKGIADKNIAPLSGKPLLAYSAEAALGSKRLDRTILNTDDEHIAQVGRDCGIDVPFLRPPELAQDDTPMIDVMRHVITTLTEEGTKPDVIVLLQPTSPLRTSQQIDEAIATFEQSEAETLVSVIDVPHQFEPKSLMTLEDDHLLPVMDPVLRRQDKRQVYARNGPAILIVNTDFLLQEGKFYGQHCVPYVMDGITSVDIDHASDLAYAEWLLQHSKGSQLHS